MPTLSDSFHLIDRRQRAWARRNQTRVDGRGRVATIEANLFRALHRDTLQELREGDGDELNDKIRAVYSSSALTCNFFDYWRENAYGISHFLGVHAPSAARLRFEQRLPIFSEDPSSKAKPPNLDVLLDFHTDVPTGVGIECKFTEPFIKYERGRRAFTSTYFGPQAEGVWEQLPHCKHLAKSLLKDEQLFLRLDAAQLIKAALALQRKFGEGKWKLLYIWYDISLSGHQTVESNELELDLKNFGDQISTEIAFEPLTWQDLYRKVHAGCSGAASPYLEYLAERYFNDNG